MKSVNAIVPSFASKSYTDRLTFDSEESDDCASVNDVMARRVKFFTDRIIGFDAETNTHHPFGMSLLPKLFFTSVISSSDKPNTRLEVSAHVYNALLVASNTSRRSYA